MKTFLLLFAVVLAVTGRQWVKILNQCDYDIDLIVISEEDHDHHKLPGRGIYCEDAIAGIYQFYAAGEVNITAYILTEDYPNLHTRYWILAQVYHEPKVAIRPIWNLDGKQCGDEIKCDRLGCPDATTDPYYHWQKTLTTKGKVMEIRYCYDQIMEDLPCPHQPPPSLMESRENDD